MILEYQDRIGGRTWKTDFGQDEKGEPYTIEIGANWVRISRFQIADCRSPEWMMYMDSGQTDSIGFVQIQGVGSETDGRFECSVRDIA